MLDDTTKQELREQHYNATIVDIIWQHEKLACFRIKPDFDLPEYKSGQYTTLGLGHWEARHKDAVPEKGLDEKKVRRLGRRAYSVSHPMANGEGELYSPGDLDFLEFYIVLVTGVEGEPAPLLTPRLFLLNVGDRVHVGQRFTGKYTLDCMNDIRDDENSLVVFAGTGTGEGPHNHMIWELLRTDYKGQIACINVVRYKNDLTYEPIYRTLEKKYPRLSYHSLTTRESDTVSNKVYAQDYLASGAFEKNLGRKLDPANTHLFLCGNPAMIGIPKIRDGNKVWPEGGPGAIQVMEERGFTMDHGQVKGNIHYEKYW